MKSVKRSQLKPETYSVTCPECEKKTYAEKHEFETGVVYCGECYRDFKIED